MRRNRGKWKRPAVTGNWIQSSWLVQPVLCYWSWANNWTTTNWTYMYILLYNCFCFKESFKMLWGEMEESEKASVTGQSSWLVQPVLCHWATTTGQPLTLTILNTYVLHTSGSTEMSQSHTQSHQSQALWSWSYVFQYNSWNSMRSELYTAETKWNFIWV